MLIDFKEIPQANTGEGNQDTWELFARDFFESQGFVTRLDPSRGADNGLDLKISKSRPDAYGNVHEVNWLVSCKHFAHSGNSVKAKDELDVHDRVLSNGCTGFIGFYSTLAASSLRNKLDGLRHSIEYDIFDCKKIEGRIVNTPACENLLLRYFPYSFRSWRELYYLNLPVKLFTHYFNCKGYEDTLIKNIFGTIENSIQAFIRSASFEGFLALHSIECVCYDSIFEPWYNYKGNDFLTLLIPGKLAEDLSVEVKPDPILFSVHLVDRASYILYPNHFIYDRYYKSYYHDMFHDIKKMLS